MAYRREKLTDEEMFERYGGRKDVFHEINATPEEKIAWVRSILTDGYKHFYGQGRPHAILLDLFSASAVVGLYDGLNEQNKAKLAAMPIERMVSVAYTILEKHQRGAT